MRKCENCDILLCNWKGEALEDAALAAGRKAMEKGADAPTAARLAKEVLKDMMLLSSCIVALIRMRLLLIHLHSNYIVICLLVRY